MAGKNDDQASAFIENVMGAASVDDLPLLPQRDVPPIHPGGTVDIMKDPKFLEILKKKQGGAEMPTLFDTKKFEGMQVRLRSFNTEDEADIGEYEKIWNHGLHDGWVIAQEKWFPQKDGSCRIIMKYLEPSPERQRKREKEKMQREGRKKNVV